MERSCIPIKRFIAIVIVSVLLCAMSWTAYADNASPEVLAVYSCPNTQIITESDHSKQLADTVIFLYKDSSYVQYVNHENRYELYSTGSFDVNFNWENPGWQDLTPHILTVHTQNIHAEDHQLTPVDLTYDIDLDRVMDYCLYPDDVQTDLKLVAAFMQVDKQKLVKADGSEQYLPTIWFYYDNGTFQQYAVIDGEKDVLFSSGEYSVAEEASTSKSLITLHRTQKYQDGIGLADYDSTHEYVLGELGFIRVFPSADAQVAWPGATNK